MKSFKRLKDRGGKYHGKENVKYKDPGYSKHEIDYPEDEPHMKSKVSKQEMHEAEKNFHMEVPNQTKKTLPKRIPRARMKMEERPVNNRLIGNLVEEGKSKGIKDGDGWEDMGPEEMQENDAPESKEHRKKIAIAVVSRKMKKKSKSY